MRWWNVRNRTPSGLELNCVWFIRQALYATLPPLAAIIFCESIKMFKDKVEIEAEEKRKVSVNIALLNYFNIMHSVTLTGSTS